jgi:hypothetical protein
VTRWVSAALLVVVLAVPAAARADGDPASDFLLTQPLFQPYTQKQPKADVDRLLAVQNEAKKQGFEIRVALIAGRGDLGVVPSLFNRPQAYAQFLWQEVRFVYHGPLLVVMPGGYGYWEQGGKIAAEKAALARLPPPRGTADLARAAAPAVQAVAAVNGVHVTVPKFAGPSNTRDRILIAVGAALVAALVLGVLALRRRRASRRPRT